MSSCSDVQDVKPINYSVPSLEDIPLSERRKFLRSDSHSPTLQNDARSPFTRCSSLGAAVKKEHEDCDSQVTCPTIQTNATGMEKTSANVSIVSRFTTLSDIPATVKFEDSVVLLSSVDKDEKTSPQLGFPIPEMKKEISEDSFDDLDHIVLKERLRMLLARKLPGLSNPAFEGNSGGLLGDVPEQTVEEVSEEIYSDEGKTTVAKDQRYDTPEGSNTLLFELPLGAASVSLSTDYASPRSTNLVIPVGLQENNRILKSRGMIMQFDSHLDQNLVPINNDGLRSSTCPSSVRVKDEPWVNSENHNVNNDAVGSISIEHPNVKSEWESHDEHHDDQVEHISLIDRLNFLRAGKDSSSSSRKTKLASFILSSNFSESAEPINMKCRRKRKKTATDSVQTALEEDAPGLLQVLLDKGVLVDEIKLYGEAENDEALDESFCEGGFADLEAVMTRLFSDRESYMKFPIIRTTKASRLSYCLACLISLVDQTQYLKFRKWPVEWGWCRDLQSFIFVFERHNRIVLERPEYGYATYFFELVKSLPVEWQIKRLVIAMKLTTCSRISLIENKELLVGEDLTEEEAKVLMEYGWTPNSGLGTMLNYRDRVVHDRKSEKEVSEWRSKIGKLLMDGFNGGTIVTPNIPKKVEEYWFAQNPNISSGNAMSD